MKDQNDDKKDIVITLRISKKTNDLLDLIISKKEKSIYIRNLIEKDLQNRMNENQLKLF